MLLGIFLWAIKGTAVVTSLLSLCNPRFVIESSIIARYACEKACVSVKIRSVECTLNLEFENIGKLPHSTFSIPRVNNVLCHEEKSFGERQLSSAHENFGKKQG